MVRRRPGFGPFPALLLVALALLIAEWPLLGAAQEGTPPAGTRPDLAAMPVTPADLDAMGLPGFGRLANGFFASFDAYVESEAEFLGKSVGETRAFHRGIGWSRSYGSSMGLPSVPGDEESPPLRGLFTNILEVGDAAGAAAYLDFVLTPGAPSAWEVEVLEAPFALGQRALLVLASLDDPQAETRYVEFSVVFQVDNLIATAGFWVDVPRGPATPAATDAAGLASPAATVAEVELLGRRQLERIEAVRAGGAPGLPDLLLRLGDDPAAATADYGEGYRLLNGENLPYYGGREDDLLADPAATAGADAVYELESLFQPSGQAAAGDPYLLNRLYRFPDEAAAAAFMASRPEALATGGFRLVEGAAPETASDLLPGVATDLGDESLAFAFVRAFAENRYAGYEVFVRVGATVAAVSLEGPPGMLPDLVTEIAAAQAACLDAGACPDALPVPPALLTAPDAATPAP